MGAVESRTQLTAGRVASLVGGTLIGDSDTVIAGVASLERAGPGDLSFLASGKYLSEFETTRAGVVLMPPALVDAGPGTAARVVVSSPHHALHRVMTVLYPERSIPWGVHPTATVGRGTTWEGRIAVLARSVIGRRVHLGPDCVIGPHVVIGDDVTIGAECRIDAHVTIEPGVALGHRVIVCTGARVGSPGFGYVSDEGDGGTHRRLPAVGRCVIEEDVEIGANATIDRGGVGDTVVGAGTKIDNLVQIAHNVRIGRRCLVMAQVGLAGSTVLEDDVVVAGQAGLAGHLTVGAGAQVAAQSGVIGDVPPGETVSGYPARRHRDVLRQTAALRRLAPLVGRIESLVREPAAND